MNWFLLLGTIWFSLRSLTSGFTSSKYNYVKKSKSLSFLINKAKYPVQNKSRTISLVPDSNIMVNFNEALLVNGISFLGLLLSKQSSLTTAGLIHSGILGVGLWTFLGFKVN